MKTCIKCGEEKYLELFAKGKNYKDGRRNICKKCHTEYTINYYKNNPDKKAEKIRMNSVSKPQWKRHNMSKDIYDILIAKFDGKCHACRDSIGISIDHDHSCCPGGLSCGKCVMGILCHHCNTALGFVKDSEKILIKLIEYLNNSPR